MRLWGRQLMRGRKSCPCQRGDCVSLAILSEGKSGIVYCNNDLKTIERGLYIGAKVTIFRNNPDEPNIIVAVGDARYVLDRRIATHIRVKVD